MERIVYSILVINYIENRITERLVLSMHDETLELLRAAKAMRVYRGISQDEMGKRLGLAQCQISNIETGKRIPRLDTYVQYLNEAGCMLQVTKEA